MGLDLDEGKDIMEHDTNEDRMTQVQLWEEEAAAIAEVAESNPQSSVPEMKEVHRFFPPGRIMHIITFMLEMNGSDSGDSTSSGETDNGNQPPAETKVGIFLTPRSLYSKLRLSQTMIADHFMPVYRRQIEKLITELEKEASKAVL